MGWLVLDLGSGHKPHPRADVLVDRFLLDNAERSGQAVSLPAERPFIVADACAMPFKEGAFDFVICSHVAEHVEDVDAFCAELNRVTHRGYLETPSRLAETLRHAPNHRWFVSNHNGLLEFNAASGGYPLGWLGKLFFSFYFYGNIQARGRNVFKFAYGVNKPWHFCLRLIRLGLVWLWLLFRPLTYTRFRWEDRFSWIANPERKRFAQ
jgi:hypothetical protein